MIGAARPFRHGSQSNPRGEKPKRPLEIAHGQGDVIYARDHAGLLALLT
jgi:hypothetical protein